MDSGSDDQDISFRESSSDDDDDDVDDDSDEIEDDDASSLKSTGRVSSASLDALSRLLPPRVDGQREDSGEKTCSAESAEPRTSFVCSFEGCSKTFGRPSRLETHIRTHTGERPFRCDIPGCHKAYSRNQHLKRHLQAHEKADSSSKRRPKKAESATQSPTLPHKKLLLTESSRVKRDPALMLNSTPSSTFTCAFLGCRKTLASERSLKAHMNIHGGVRFSCSFDGCSQSYPTLKSLKRHEKELHGPKMDSVLCPDTPSESEWEETKNGVEKLVNDDDGRCTFKTYSCKSCDKTFKKHWQLKTHSYDHSGVLPFHCKEGDCDRAFLYRSHLRRHVKQSHRLHRCQLYPRCDSVFESSLEARRHLQQTHVGIVKGRKKCQKCGKSVKSDRMKAHLHTHSEVRTVFECPRKDCDRQFLAKKNLVAHIKTNHGGVSSVGGPNEAEACGVNGHAVIGGGGIVDNNNIDGDDNESGKEPRQPPRLPCLVAGCDVTFVSKTTRDRHVKNQHEKRNPDVPKEPRKSKPKRDFAKELTGFYQPLSRQNENEEGEEKEDDKKGGLNRDSYVLESLNLPSRHDMI